MVDSPLLDRSDFGAVLKTWGVRPATPAALSGLSTEARARSLIIVQDSFTRYFEHPPLAALIELAARLGFQVWLAPLRPNGKPLHVQGFLPAFERAAIRNARNLQALAAFGIPLVGLDPAMTLVYRQEYLKVNGIGEVPQVMLPQEWLMTIAEVIEAALGSALPAQPAYRLLPHCTEKTSVSDSPAQWVRLFQQFGLTLDVPATGCCGMSGTYGHETRNLETSKTIYGQSWQAQIEAPTEHGEVLATGYSCRSQVKRMAGQRLRHPVEVLAERLR